MSESTQRYERLMQPGMIGPVTTRNRIIKTANGTSYMEADQTVGDRMVAYDATYVTALAERMTGSG